MKERYPTVAQRDQREAIGKVLVLMGTRVPILVSVDSAEVGEVLTERQPAVDVNAVEHRRRVELLPDARGSLFEVFRDRR
jgi:hypothetical protein